MIIGFGNGCYYRLEENPLERYSEKFLDIFSISGASAIELNCIYEQHIDYLLENELDLSNFNYISIHGPALIISDNEESNRILAKLEVIKNNYPIKNIIFHLDRVEDWTVFSKFSDLPISIENMDNRKNYGRSVRDIKQILDKYDFGFTLDLQHCYVNDKSMKLADKFHKEFSNRLVEYHLSGFDEKLLHYPLFKTEQDEIITSLQNKKVPIIIESTFNRLGDQEKELQYIKNFLT